MKILRKLRGRIWRFSSLRQELMAYTGFLFAFVIVVSVVASIFNYKAMRNFHDYSAQFTTLKEFYQEISFAESAASNFLYTGKENYLMQYNKAIGMSYTKLEEMTSAFENEQTVWSFGLLKNMVDTYDETFVKVCDSNNQDSAGHAVTYDFFVGTAKNIHRTTGKYYNLITDEMNLRCDQIQQDLQRQTFVLLAGIGTVILIVIVFASLFVKDITGPIKRIVDNINLIKQGKYDLKLVNHAGKEIIVLCDAFEEMAASIKENIGNMEERAFLEKCLLEQKNENLRVKDLLVHAELKALQHQINPHFLFNTLSMITKMAYIESAQNTREMMETVSDLLRYSMDKASRISDLYSEIECVKNYFSIQRKRMGHRVNFSLAVAEGLPNTTMPGMLLQPLVENSIVHGVGQVIKGAQVEVRAIYDNRQIYIVVEDNGIGIDGDVLEQILYPCINSDSRFGERSIGLQNVIQRLDMFYGKAGNMQIESNTDCGTMIIITIPIEQEG